MKLHSNINSSRKSWQDADFLCMPLEVKWWWPRCFRHVLDNTLAE